MPVAGVLPAPSNSPNTQAATAPPHAATGQAPPVYIPFTRGAYEHYEPVLDVSQIIDANTHNIGPFDVPAYGYLRSLLIKVDATGGVASVTVAAFEDSPWAALNTIIFYDVDGAPVLSLSGHDLYLVHKFGNNFLLNPSDSPSFSAVAVGASASGNFSFILRLPIEISARDGYGSLPNQASNSTFKCLITMANAAGIYTTAPNTTLPTIRWRVWAEEWSQPNSADLMGRPQMPEPPDAGTTMFWSKSVKVIGAGFQTVRIDRVGNLLRNIIFIFRSNTPLRDTVDFPDPIQLMWDGRIVTNEGRDIRRHLMQEHYAYTPANLDTGVFVFDFIHDFTGKAGAELRDLWIPTTQGSRLDLVGTFAVAGNLTILVNDVQPVGNIYTPVV